MPIARTPASAVGLDSLPILYRGVVVPPGVPFLAGAAVGIIGVGSIGCGSIGSVGGLFNEYVLCGALPGDYPETFTGFLMQTLNPCDEGMVICGRGSRVVPIVEFGASLVAGTEVYLSDTPGEVTQTPPGGRILRVGFALNDVEMILVTDYYL